MTFIQVEDDTQFIKGTSFRIKIHLQNITNIECITPVPYTKTID